MKGSYLHKQHVSVQKERYQGLAKFNRDWKENKGKEGKLKKKIDSEKGFAK